MLVMFKFRNYGPFKDEAVLDMRAVALGLITLFEVVDSGLEVAIDLGEKTLDRTTAYPLGFFGRTCGIDGHTRLVFIDLVVTLAEALIEAVVGVSTDSISLCKYILTYGIGFKRLLSKRLGLPSCLYSSERI